MERHKEDLKENGYTIFRNLLDLDEINEYKNEFYKWFNKVPHLKKLHSMIDFNGIFKYHEVGNQRFAWLMRTNPKIINVFKQLWETDELVTSFDGCCYYPEDYIGKDIYWTHTDQSSRKIGTYCYQSFISLTNNNERSLMIYKGSNLLHEDYFKTMNIDEPTDWSIIDINYILSKKLEPRVLIVNAGDLVVWDSRTFHQNLCGNSNCNEERLVQYLCYLPKNKEENNYNEKINRKIYFENRRTTNHWPYPMNLVPKQPYRYNLYNPENPIIIDYNFLPKPYLYDLKDDIYKLL